MDPALASAGAARGAGCRFLAGCALTVRASACCACALRAAFLASSAALRRASASCGLGDSACRI